MESKRNIVIGSIVGIIVLFFLAFYFTYPLRANASRKSDILNFINQKSTHNIDKTTKESYNYLKNYNSDTEEYDVSKLINDYINKIVNSAYVAYKYPDVTYYTVATINPNLNDSEAYSLLFLDEDCSKYLTILRDANIVISDIDTFKESLIKQVEMIIPHKSSAVFEGWVLSRELLLERGTQVDEHTWNIELPYKTVLTIQETQVENLKRKYTSLEVLSNKIHNYRVKAKYSQESKEFTVQFNNYELKNHHKYDMNIELNDIIFKVNRGYLGIFCELH